MRTTRFGFVALLVVTSLMLLAGPAAAERILPPLLKTWRTVAPRTGPVLPAPSRPIVLVHGFAGSSLDFDTIRVRLEAAGVLADRIHAVNFAYPTVGSNRHNAMQLARKVGDVLARHRVARVDIIAHSMGNLSTRYYLKKMGGTRFVHTYISVGAMHGGLPDDGLGSPCGLPGWIVDTFAELCAKGSFVAELNSGDPTPGAIRYVSLFSTTDEVVPVASSWLEGADNLVFSGPLHSGRFGLLEDRSVFDTMLPYLAGE